MAMGVSVVPVIDIGPARTGGLAERRRVAAAIDDACREFGFFAIPGHGVAERLVDDQRRRAHEFFSLPPAEKLASRPPVAGTNRG
jgi:isopenicillin N synthase-like dioxygenase